MADDFTYQTVYDELNRVKEEWTPYDPGEARYNRPDKTIYWYDAVGRVATVSAPPTSDAGLANANGTARGLEAIDSRSLP